LENFSIELYLTDNAIDLLHQTVSLDSKRRVPLRCVVWF